jgi:2-C-methyl-D-erythritol 4-phosphate cytidylyltransferase/2-C-methyl-D-erythritol 2,4-cyclodiphosphate synthase
MSVAVIIAAGGRGSRLGASTPKQLLPIAGKSLLARSVEAFVRDERVDEIVVVVPADCTGIAAGHVAVPQRVRARIVAGGARRQDSVVAGLRALSADAELILVHDAARAFVPSAVIARTIDAARRDGAAIAAIAAQDTVKRARRRADVNVVSATLPRDEIFLAQTPQGFRRDVLEAAVALGVSGIEATDEARLAEMAGFDVTLVEGDPRNIKVTTLADMEVAEALCAREAGARVELSPFRVGFGYDSHRLALGRPLILGGVRIPFDRGLVGHSDADAVAHAVIDALLGAAALGDIGQMFPDTDPRWKDADSMSLLGDAVARLHAAGLRCVNVDVTVIADRPRLGPFRDQIRASLAGVLRTDVAAVSTKAKTSEGLEAAMSDAVVVHAVALVARVQPS